MYCNENIIRYKIYMEYYYYYVINVKKKKKEMRYYIWMNKGLFVIKFFKRFFWKDNFLFYI